MSAVDALPSRRERKEERHPEAIHDARAVPDRGARFLAAVTLEAITERADVSLSVRFFNYFPFQGPCRPRQGIRIGRPGPNAPSRAVPPTRPPSRRSTTSSCRSFSRATHRRAIAAPLPSGSVRAHPAGDAARRIRRDGTGDGPPSSQPAPQARPAATCTPRSWCRRRSAAMRVAIMRWCEGGGTEPLEPVVVEAFDHLANGLIVSTNQRTANVTVTDPTPRPPPTRTAPQYNHRQILVIHVRAHDGAWGSRYSTRHRHDRPDHDQPGLSPSRPLQLGPSPPTCSPRPSPHLSHGKISDLFGPRNGSSSSAIVVFLIGSALSGLKPEHVPADHLPRHQGLGAGGLMSLVMAIVGDVIPPRDPARYQGYFGACSP